MKTSEAKRPAGVQTLADAEIEKVNGGVLSGFIDGVAVVLGAIEHAITAPRDPASGLPTGQRLHKPFVP